MKDIKEFEKKWKEKRYHGVRVTMTGSWAERHKTEFNYLNNHDIVNYLVIGDKEIELTGDDGITLYVSVYDILSCETEICHFCEEPVDLSSSYVRVYEPKMGIDSWYHLACWDV